VALAQLIQQLDIDVFDGQIVRVDALGHYLMFGESVTVHADASTGALCIQGGPASEYLLDHSPFSFSRSFRRNFEQQRRPSVWARRNELPDDDDDIDDIDEVRDY
jgi:hypothetical protein